MHKLTFYKTEFTDELSNPSAAPGLSPEDSALEVLTDFHIHEPVVTALNTPVSEARDKMFKENIHLLIVMDKDQHFSGIVSMDDISTEQIIRKVSHGERLQELVVSDFMRNRDQLKAFSYAELSGCSIQDVIETLSGSGQQHCLVVDRDQHKIRGIISARDIAKKLNLAIPINKQKYNFSEIFWELFPAHQWTIDNAEIAH